MKPTKLARQAFVSARQAQKRAHAPYSKFYVGAAVVSGAKVFSGCNVENASYGATVCAERVAILKAVSEGHRDFSDVVVVTSVPKPVPPCALCLQVMAEFCKPSTRVWIADRKRVHEIMLLSDLYPRAFNASELNQKRKKSR
jgi:cytidine deaminase